MQESNSPEVASIGALASRPRHEGLESIALVIFDCDGVLIDSEPIASRTLAKVLRDAGIGITDAHAHAKFTGNSEGGIRDLLVRDFGVREVDGLFRMWHRHLFAEFEHALRAMPGITEIVIGLDRPKCVASNSSMMRLERSLGRLDLWRAFSPEIFSADAVARPKPAPDLMLHCASRFSATPERCVMIDDSPHGVEAAVSAGMLAIGFVDPADPRPDRPAVLSRSGAFAVATGAGELMPILIEANRFLRRARGESKGALE